ncbi:hypothetical protein GWI33_006733 [Rhynchophorus ferrugineus]|uniref:Protein misato n=1 Tax=Rhynchophorus ferrugineus TaxID=354439 RepID=A0A834MF94_RHYFE|nr:hypothetical protein GWI33_006733 [Rhynchophorus ferrugineus]
MTSREILTLQLGHYANFVGAHWWNLQEQSFDYHGAQPSQVDHDVLYREGRTLKGQTTFTPRLLLVDLKGSLKSLPKEGELYEDLLPESGIEWDQEKFEVKQDKKPVKNKFQTEIESPIILPEAVNKKYNLEESVEVWSDYLYSRFHPRSINIINEYQHANKETPFDSYSLGVELSKTECFQEDFNDKIRNYVEECDHFQGFHMLTDCTNGFSGLSSSCLENIRDE